MQLGSQTSPSATGLRGAAATVTAAPAAAHATAGITAQPKTQRLSLRQQHRHRKSNPGDATYIGNGATKDAEWFEGFDEDESTYYAGSEPAPGEKIDNSDSYLPGSEGSPTYLADAAWQPEHTKLGRAMDSEWFEETKSGESNAAWQTYYPGLPADRINGMPVTKGPMGAAEEKLDGAFPGVNSVRDYMSHKAVKSATWFDTSAAKYDAFERRVRPSSNVPYERSWSERTKSINIECKDPGCMANAILTVLDTAKEEHESCRMSIGIHATDFDDDYSNETVEMLSINGERLTSCNPMASGCSDTRPKEKRELYPCLTDFELSQHLLSSGTLNISAKLSPKVDECPVDGNLLSGSVTVKCYVRNISKSIAAEMKANVKPNMSTNLTTKEMLLQCKTPGCVATAQIDVGEESVNKSCKLTVKLNQTDFDGDLGSNEIVEFIEVDGKNVGKDMKPGRNPCKEVSLGSLSGNETVAPYAAVKDVAINLSATLGFKVNVSAKISDMVDECGRDGFLLDAIARVECQ
jgi:hypothetical protein